MVRLVIFLAVLNASIFADISGKIINSSGGPVDSVKISFILENVASYSDANGVFSLIVQDEITSLDSKFSVSFKYEKLNVYSILGQHLMERFNISFDDLNHEIQNLDQGLYILQIQNEDQQWFLKFSSGTMGLKILPLRLNKIYSNPVEITFEKVGYQDTVILVSNSTINLGTIVMKDLAISSSLNSSSSYVHVLDTGSFVDQRDGHSYHWTKIGEQVWMAQNLNFASTNSSCYDNSIQNCDQYGRLYRWREAMNGDSSSVRVPSGVQGVCPVGWHVPSKNEWKTLTDYVTSQTGLTISEIGEKLKAGYSWAWNTGGTNDFGFSALAGGKLSDNNSSEDLGNFGYWWDSSEILWQTSGFKEADNVDMKYKYDLVKFSMSNQNYSYSVRCVKNQIPDSSSSAMVDWCETAGNCGVFTDLRDTQQYHWTKIGSQVWMSDNLNYNTSKSYCYEDKVEKCSSYGRLYEWSDAQHYNTCPNGWKLPSNAQWDSLANYISINSKIPLAMVSSKLKSTTGWFSKGYGSDDYAFHGLPGGEGNSSGQFYGESTEGVWWSVDKDGDYAYTYKTGYSNELLYRSLSHKEGAKSVRCILKNGAVLP